SLGINMVFKRKNDGNQWYITDPKTLKSAWFKKIDREYRDNNKLNQWDKIRNLSQEEKNELNIQSVNDLV
ncbi:ZmpA/ZmpB/ZmpC family metallo-endopeptidase, partial [Streptococcus pneumoniae]|uniref:ZmpA/ZmpB/ZmpC family metallo-endopeptidase n=1 Tax=Streptococcus pneumoniae TaxID=1313 RepID=UPI000B2A24E6